MMKAVGITIAAVDAKEIFHHKLVVSERTGRYGRFNTNIF